MRTRKLLAEAIAASAMPPALPGPLWPCSWLPIIGEVAVGAIGQATAAAPAATLPTTAPALYTGLPGGHHRPCTCAACTIPYNPHHTGGSDPCCCSSREASSRLNGPYCAGAHTTAKGGSFSFTCSAGKAPAPSAAYKGNHSNNSSSGESFSSVVAASRSSARGSTAVHHGGATAETMAVARPHGAAHLLPGPTRPSPLQAPQPSPLPLSALLPMWPLPPLPLGGAASFPRGLSCSGLPQLTGRAYSHRQGPRQQQQGQGGQASGTGAQVREAHSSPAGRSAPPPSAAELLAPLVEGRPFTVSQIPGRGRGLVATRDIAVGEEVHCEAPLLAFPALEGRHKVCYNCLAALPGGARDAVRHRPTGRWFCCAACRAAAMAAYHSVEEAAAAAAAAATAAAPASAPSAPDHSVAARQASDGGAGGGGPLAELYEQCRAHGERFPLMAARLAFMRVTAAVREHLEAAAAAAAQPPPQGLAAPEAPVPSAAADSATAAVPPADPVNSLHVLCFANVGTPFPDPWVAQHALLVSALRALAADGAALRRLAAALQPPAAPAAAATSSSASAPTSGAATDGGSGGGEGLGPMGLSEPRRRQLGAEEADDDADVVAEPGVAAAVAAAVEELTVEWFVGVLARLHLNVFQVHNPLAGADPADLAAAAAALVSDSGGGAASAGSAVYLLASLFNHSCDPSLELSFPSCDGSAAFTAARDIAAGEELTVSYLDVGLPYKVRRQHLEWSYGFVCGCGRCREEASEAGAEARA